MRHESRIKADDPRAQARSTDLPEAGSLACQLVDGKVTCSKAAPLANGMLLEPSARFGPARVISLAVAEHNGDVCALEEGGRIRCVNGEGEEQRDATLVAPGAIRLEMSAFVSHGCVLHRSGQVSCFADRKEDKDGQRMPWRLEPVLVESGTPLASVVDLGVGEEHACARTKDKRVYCWGNNGRGQLAAGFDLTKKSKWARRVPEADGADELATRDDYACLRRGQEVLCWGHVYSSAFEGGDQASFTPRPLSFGCGATRVLPGQDGPIVLDARGTVLAYGMGEQGGWGVHSMLTDAVDARLVGDAICTRLRDGQVRCADATDPWPLAAQCNADAQPLALPPYAPRTASILGFATEHGGRPGEPATGKKLSTSDQKALLDLLGSRETFQGPDVRCFEPRHTFVMLDQKGTQVASVEVCFECHKMAPTPIPVAAIVGQSASTSQLSKGAYDTLALICRSTGLQGCPTESQSGGAKD